MNWKDYFLIEKKSRKWFFIVLAVSLILHMYYLSRVYFCWYSWKTLIYGCGMNFLESSLSIVLDVIIAFFVSKYLFLRALNKAESKKEE